MKIRNGFVSNSSSSSFLVIGCNVKNESDKTKEELYKAGFRDAGYYLDYDDEDFIGFVETMSEESNEILSYSPSMFTDVERKIKNIIPGADVRVLFGLKYG